jgi:ABC-type transport system substrate-binding protein
MNYARQEGGRQLYYGRRPRHQGHPRQPDALDVEKDARQKAWDELPAYDVDLDKAKSLLAESGVADKLNGKTIAYYEPTPS